MNMDPLKLIKIADKLDKIGKYNESDFLIKLSQVSTPINPSLGQGYTPIDPSLTSNSYDEFVQKLWEFGTKNQFSHLADAFNAYSRSGALLFNRRINTIPELNQLYQNIVNYKGPIYEADLLPHLNNILTGQAKRQDIDYTEQLLNQSGGILENLENLADPNVDMNTKDVSKNTLYRLVGESKYTPNMSPKMKDIFSKTEELLKTPSESITDKAKDTLQNISKDYGIDVVIPQKQVGSNSKNTRISQQLYIAPEIPVPSNFAQPEPKFKYDPTKHPNWGQSVFNEKNWKVDKKGNVYFAGDKSVDFDPFDPRNLNPKFKPKLMPLHFNSKEEALEWFENNPDSMSNIDIYKYSRDKDKFATEKWLFSNGIFLKSDYPADFVRQVFSLGKYFGINNLADAIDKYDELGATYQLMPIHDVPILTKLYRYIVNNPKPFNERDLIEIMEYKHIDPTIPDPYEVK